MRYEDNRVMGKTNSVSDNTGTQHKKHDFELKR
jgi:hypothetical protein